MILRILGSVLGHCEEENVVGGVSEILLARGPLRGQVSKVGGYPPISKHGNEKTFSSMYFAAISMFTFDGQRPKSISVQT